MHTDLQFQAINSWDQVTPFAGHIVAYKTDSDYFKTNKNCLINNTCFAYIDKTVLDWGPDEKKRNEQGHNMTRLLKIKNSFGFCALINSQLANPISMRLITEEESSLIREALKTNIAVFENVFPKQIMDLVLNRSAKL